MIPPFFILKEYCPDFGHSYSWRLKDGEIRFRGHGCFAGLVTRRIPASESQIDRVFDAFDLLDVWNWNKSYMQDDIDSETLYIGTSYSWFIEIATIDGRTHKTYGVEAYPSFADASKASMAKERFDLLSSAIYSCFAINAYAKPGIPRALPGHVYP